MKFASFLAFFASAAAALSGPGLAQAWVPGPPPRPPAPPPRFANEAAPRGSIAGLISEDDYPAEARDANQEGRVGVRLFVDTSGRVSRCVIVQSSGFASLDSQTCKILQERARFTPARDARGAAIQGSVLQRVAWKLENPTVPNQAWARRGRVTLTGPGPTASCVVEGQGAVAGQESLLWDCKELLEGFAEGSRPPVAPGSNLIFTMDDASSRSGLPTCPSPPFRPVRCSRARRCCGLKSMDGERFQTAR